jgi:AmiR/NasT family two-component response regulator
MKRTTIKNFRGMQALVLHRDDANRALLVSVLGRLGLDVTMCEAATDIHDWEAFDVLLFDADEGEPGVPPDASLPKIALVGSEAPSRLDRVIRLKCDSHILKPVRTSGIFTALLLAVNGHAERRQVDREIAALRQRLAGRRIVTKAVHLMALCAIDEDEAYERLRLEAMHRRVPIEEMARESLGMDDAAHETMRRAQISRKA